jgi:hypothetical protein
VGDSSGMDGGTVIGREVRFAFPLITSAPTVIVI